MLLWWIDKPFVDLVRDDNDVMFTTQFGDHFQLIPCHHLHGMSREGVFIYHSMPHITSSNLISTGRSHGVRSEATQFALAATNHHANSVQTKSGEVR